MSIDATGIDSPINTAPTSGKSADVVECTSSMETAIRLKKIRDLFGFSQRELAKRAGVTNSSISMIEQGQVSPSIQSLTRILSVFPISLPDFFNFAPDEFSTSTSLDTLCLQSPSHQQLDTCIVRLSADEFTAFGIATVDISGVVISGRLTLTLLTGDLQLDQGDRFYIPARQLFRFINLTKQDASLFRCSLFVQRP